MLMKAPQDETFADLLHRLGGISPARILMRPAPGTATVEDVIRMEQRENRLCELVDGVLVEKAMGFTESRIAAILIGALQCFVELNDLGVVTAPDGMFRFPENLVRMPDVAFASWDCFPGGVVSDEPVPRIVPDLAVEVLSATNTKGEMARKLREYFGAGVRLVWLIDPINKTVAVLTSPTRSKIISVPGMLDGGKVLPGFELPLAKLFEKPKRLPTKRKRNRN
jgi:Uma2 family endonuclease